MFRSLLRPSSGCY